MGVRVKTSLYCTCGASTHVNGPMSLLEAIVAQWRKDHRGDGHKKCDAKTAAAARRRAERASVNGE